MTVPTCDKNGCPRPAAGPWKGRVTFTMRLGDGDYGDLYAPVTSTVKIHLCGRHQPRPEPEEEQP